MEPVFLLGCFSPSSGTSHHLLLHPPGLERYPPIPSIMKSLLVSLLSLAVWSVTGESDVTGKHGTVEAKAGDDIVLRCHIKPPYDLKALRVEWTHNGKEVHLYRKEKDELGEQDENFTGRTSVFHDEIANGNISLRLSPVEDRDVGNYICRVKVSPDSPEVLQCTILLRIVPEREPEPEPEPGAGLGAGAGSGAGKGHTNYAYLSIAVPVIGVLVAVFVLKKKCKKNRGL